MLGHRPISDPAELATVVAECVAHLDAGIRLFDGPAIAGDVAVELAGVDASGRLALILCDIVAGPESVLRGLEAQAWWREHPALAARVFADGTLNPPAPPRVFVVATRWSDRALRLLRALGPLAPTAVECRVFKDPDGAVVALEPVDIGRMPSAVEVRAGAVAGPAPAPVQVSSPARLPDAEDAQRATVLIERLERLRFSEVFR